MIQKKIVISKNKIRLIWGKTLLFSMSLELYFVLRSPIKKVAPVETTPVLLKVHVVRQELFPLQ